MSRKTQILGKAIDYTGPNWEIGDSQKKMYYDAQIEYRKTNWGNLSKKQIIRMIKYRKTRIINIERYKLIINKNEWINQEHQRKEKIEELRLEIAELERVLIKINDDEKISKKETGNIVPCIKLIKKGTQNTNCIKE